MKDVDAFIADLRTKLKDKKTDREIVREFVSLFLSSNEMKKRYPMLSVLLFEKNNSIMSEEKYKDSYVIDYRFQWLVSDVKDENTIFDATQDITDVHYFQIHLYMYYHSERFHSPAKLSEFEFMPDETQTQLDKIKDFIDQLEEKTKLTPFLGYAVAYTDAM